MSFNGILIANRGEIAIRITRAAQDLGFRTVAVYSEDDALSLHTQIADDAVALEGIGAAAYLNMEAVIGAAQQVTTVVQCPHLGDLQVLPGSD